MGIASDVALAVYQVEAYLYAQNGWPGLPAQHSAATLASACAEMKSHKMNESA